MPDSDREGFLARWSRLKRTQGGGEAPAPAEAATDPSPLAGKPPTSPATETAQTSAGDEPAIRIEDLPRIDDLTADSDFSVFLQRGVPEELKRLALRRAWTLDPAIRDFVEMAENQYDFNAGAVPGFGALDPKTDIGQLLAQATGQWKRPGDERQNDAGNDPPVAAVPQEPAVSPTDEPSDISLEDVAAAEKLSTEEENAVPSAAPRQRRRHGGALPA